MVVVLTSFVVTSPEAICQQNNNPYSPSPQARTSAADNSLIREPMAKTIANNPVVVLRSKESDTALLTKAVMPTVEADPTRVYRIGIGDLVSVGFENLPDKFPTFKVDNNGAIDFPLAGGQVSVSGLTVEQAARSLEQKIKLRPAPRVTVFVRAFGSHFIDVKGMVQSPGRRPLPREAMPLYAVRATELIQPGATHATIRRSGGGSDIGPIALKDLAAQDLLVFPGDTVEFHANALAGKYRVFGDVTSPGERELSPALRLSTALRELQFENGAENKIAIVRRKRADGRDVVFEYDPNSNDSRKRMDPFIAPNDVIEILARKK